MRTVKQIKKVDIQAKVLSTRVSSYPMDAHFWKKHKENSLNLL